jgi:hypothetical protein
MSSDGIGDLRPRNANLDRNGLLGTERAGSLFGEIGGIDCIDEVDAELDAACMSLTCEAASEALGLRGASRVCLNVAGKENAEPDSDNVSISVSRSLQR